MELYIHIPFCIKKCNYCDFLSFSAGKDMMEAYCQALKEEIACTGEFAENESVTSIFIGGGTPSVLSSGQMEEIFSSVRKHFFIEDGAEISIEANPGTLSKEKLETYLAMGINRLSIGLQSTDDACLKRLGRIHTWKEFESNYELVRTIGFSNVNIDLMSGLPGQTLQQYEETLSIVTGLMPEHISSYSLIIEEGTPFFHSKEIQTSLPDEETDRKMYEVTKEKLQEKGYHRYEISNYAKEEKECRHNLGYWSGTPYLGLGLGASSYYKGARFSNEKKIERYLEKSYIPFEKREDYFVLEKKDKMEDYMIFGLRKMKGISISEFESVFFVPMKKIYGNVIRKYCDMGLLILDGDHLRLSEKGIDVSNQIFMEFLL